MRRYPTYRGTEEVVYLGPRGEPDSGRLSTGFGLRPADGGAHQYYDVGVERIAFEVDTTDEVEDAHARATSFGAKIHCPPEEDRDEPGYYAFFAFDPDGIRIEVFSWTPPEWSRALSGGHPAALHMDHLAVDVAGAVRCEEQHRLGDLAGIAKTLHRVHRLCLFDVLRGTPHSCSQLPEIGPGASALTRISGATSRARDAVRPRMAPFAAQ